jgi:predicted alpha-1,6-mannanase (GH76 family)
MMIKDLEMSKDLDRDALTAVRGGRNSIEQGGVYAPVANVGGGFSFSSPTTLVNTPVNAPSAVLNDNDLQLKLANKNANVLGSLGTLVAQ